MGSLCSKEAAEPQLPRQTNPQKIEKHLAVQKISVEHGRNEAHHSKKVEIDHEKGKKHQPQNALDSPEKLKHVLPVHIVEESNELKLDEVPNELELEEIPNELKVDEEPNELKDHEEPNKLKDDEESNELKVNEESNELKVNEESNELKVAEELNLERTISNNLNCDPEQNIQYLNTVCPQGHAYKWHTDLPFFYFEQGCGYSVSCRNCQTQYCTPSWHCRECRIDLCEKCGLKTGLQSPLLQCSSGHSLEWSSSTCAYYKETFNFKYAFICNNCKIEYLEPSWNCEKCNFDICIKCARSKGFNPPYDIFLCSNQHPLDLVTNKLVRNCSKCHEPCKSKHYQCEACNYFICILCGVDIFCRMVRHPGIRCVNGCNTLCLVEIAVLETTEKKLLTCKNCRRIDMKYAYFCDECNMCYCMKCEKLIERGIESAYGRKCEEGHIIEWYYNPRDDETYTCRACKKKFTCGTFYCEQCDVYYCINDIASANLG